MKHWQLTSGDIQVVGTSSPLHLETWEGGRLSDITWSHGDIFFAGGASPEKAQIRTKAGFGHHRKDMDVRKQKYMK